MTPSQPREAASGTDWPALGAALLTVALWASAFVGIRAVIHDFGPGALALGRLLPLGNDRALGVGGNDHHQHDHDADEVADHIQERILAGRLGLPFSNLSLLMRALTHRSYVNEHADASEDNERLEFLGDAVLDFVAGEWVYHRFPEMPEGDLTKMRSALVRNDQLASFARHLDLGRALRLGHGELTSGGLGRDGLLGLAFEAVIGALYLAYLGFMTLRTAHKPVNEQRAGGNVFLRGLLCDLLNPKVMLTFLSLIPQAMDPNGEPLPQAALLSAVTVGVFAL